MRGVTECAAKGNTMELSTAAMNVAPVSRATASTSGGVPPEQAQHIAPPELVSKFEALMARAGAADAATKEPSELSGSVVSKVEQQLALHSQALDNVLAVADGNMSLVEIQALQARSIVQAGVMSMTHGAYVQVLSAGKGSISSLMKNQ
jgi:hypothetical protein